jgi:hypothetical protein
MLGYSTCKRFHTLEIFGNMDASEYDPKYYNDDYFNENDTTSDSLILDNEKDKVDDNEMFKHRA